MIQKDERHERILSSSGHQLITGGPGSGKTTISIVKASLLAKNALKDGQQILFLSFARASVARVVEAIEREHRLAIDVRRLIAIETYHAFFWRLLKTHGYLIGLPRRLQILLPQGEAIELAVIRGEYEANKNLDELTKAEKREREVKELEELAFNEGRVCFSLFAAYVARILSSSERIRGLVGLMFPYVFVDEFQDTNSDQWQVLKSICGTSTVVALADPEQRIYDFIGADPKRLDHFRELCSPNETCLGTDNHRSTAREIRAFGDDILCQDFRQAKYDGVQLVPFEPYQDQAMAKMAATVLQARKRLVKSKKSDWSLGILTPTKKLTRQVSDALRSPPASLPSIPHIAAIEMDGAIIGSEVLAVFLQPCVDEQLHLESVIGKLCDFYCGKGGDAPSKSSIQEADRIRRAYEDYSARRSSGKSIRGNSLLVATIKTLQDVRMLAFTGDPDKDWMTVRDLMDNSECSRLQKVGEELRYVRLLDRGATLRQLLSENWRRSGGYSQAHSIVKQTFVQEHFAMARRPEKGVLVMNMHKAKGKQFDEVIVFEGWPRCHQGKIVSNPDRIVRGNMRQNENEQTRQNMRVAVTRACDLVTVLTPSSDPCVLFRPVESAADQRA